MLSASWDQHSTAVSSCSAVPKIIPKPTPGPWSVPARLHGTAVPCGAGTDPHHVVRARSLLPRCHSAELQPSPAG